MQTIHLTGCPKEADDRNETCDCDNIRAAAIWNGWGELRLSERDWWTELGQCKLPLPLVDMLRPLISATIHQVAGPTATSRVLALVRQCQINNVSFAGKSFVLMVSIPKDNKKYRPTFRLIESLPDFLIKHVDEVPLTFDL